MRILLASLMVFGFGLVFTAQGADEKKADAKEVTLKGKICCAKCELGVEKKCITVIVTKQDGKDVTVYFNADSNSKHHKAICTEAKAGTVTGTITDDGKKKVIDVKTLKFD